ncbi:Ift140, partial [Symbiodinium sp. KB8]
DGTGERDYLHVQDLATGHLAAIQWLERQPHAPGAATVCEAFNLGTGRPVSVLQAVKAVEAASGKQVPVKFAPRREGDLACVYADPARSKAVLGWEAKHTFEEACRDGWKWQSMNPQGFAGPLLPEPSTAAAAAETSGGLARWAGMAQYFAFDCPTGDAGDVTCVAACSVKPIVAAAVGTSILLFNDQGTRTSSPAIVRANRCVKLAWNPQRPVLVAAWEDGEGTVSSLRIMDNVVQEDRTVHTMPLSVLKWNPDGSRLVTGDQMGVFAVWSMDQRARLQAMQKYRRAGALTCVAFNRQVTTVVPSDTPGAQPVVAKLNSFFIAGEAGVVTYADDLGHAVEALTSSSSAIDVMELHTPSAGGASRSGTHASAEAATAAAVGDVIQGGAESPEASGDGGDSGRSGGAPGVPDVLVVITRNLLMRQLKVNPDGTLQPTTRVKLATKASTGLRMAVWVAPGVLATASREEGLVRFWDINEDSAGSLRLTQGGDSTVLASDRVTALAFDPMRCILSLGTEQGHVVMWRHRGGTASTSRAWAPYEHKVLCGGRAAVVHLDWCGAAATLAAATPTHAVVLSETVLHRALSAQLAATQVSARSVVVSVRGRRETGGALIDSVPLDTPYVIRGLHVSNTHVLTWSGSQVDIWQVKVTQETGVQLQQEGSFPCSGQGVALQGTSVLVAGAEDRQLSIMNFGGTVTKTLPFTAVEGTPCAVAVNGNYAAVATTGGKIKLYNASRVEPRLLHEGQFNHPSDGTSIGRVLSLACNADGSRASILAASASAQAGTVQGGPSLLSGVGTGGASSGMVGAFSVPGTSDSDLAAAVAAAGPKAPGQRRLDTNVYVYDGKLDTVLSHDVGPDRMPTLHAWDLTEPKLLGVQTERVGTGDSGAAAGDDEDVFAPESKEGEGVGDAGSSTVEVFTFFATTSADAALRVQNCTRLPPRCASLAGVDVPNIMYIAAGADLDTPIRAVPLRDFVGMHDADADTRTALLDFSYYMATGNMDAAYQAVKVVDNPAVWTNMAHMCVKSKRLDVAQVCLANMGHIRGLRALRHAMAQEPEHDAAVAMLAIQLGLLPDAAKLYQSAGRFDLLNTLYQRAGLWERAIGVAETKDRIHASTTHFAVARHLEAIADFRGATEQYEKAGVALQEVPRMLVDAQRLRELRDFVNSSDDPAVWLWWGQFLESNGEPDRAIAYYAKAESTVDLVRVTAAKGDLDGAAKLVQESGDEAAAYYLARQYELGGNTDAALYFYEKSKRFNHAARLSKASGKDSQLMALALQSTKDVMVETAEYFISKGALDKAVTLLHKGGHTSRALDLCFQGQLFDDLQAIADDIGEGDEADPEVLQQCAEFFMTHGKYEKAVSLLLAAHQHEEALELCIQHKVPISEEMAEALTLPKLPPGAAAASPMKGGQ